MPLVGAVTAALFAGLGGGVLAAAESSELVTHVTGVVVIDSLDDSEEEWWIDPVTVGHARGFKQFQAVEWSLPRLPPEMQTVLNFDMYHIGQFRETPFTGSSLLAGPDGYWTGTATDFSDTDGACYAMELPTGHVAYEGLHATLLGQLTEAGESVWDGYIYEGESLPMPDPIEPAAESPHRAASAGWGAEPLDSPFPARRGFKCQG